MKLNIVKSLFSLLCISFSLNSGQAMDPAQIDYQVEIPLLFELSIDDTVQGYILGTQHNLPLTIFSQPVRDILSSCQTTFTEVTSRGDITVEDLIEIGVFRTNFPYKLVDHLDFLENQTFESIITNEKSKNSIWSDIVGYWETYNPWFVYTVLCKINIERICDNYHAHEGMDSQLDKITPNLHGLESQKERIIAMGFPKINNYDAIRHIKVLLQNWDQEIYTPSDLSNQCYCRGDLNEIEEKNIINNSSEIMTNDTIYTRNDVMLTNFVKHVQTPDFIGYPFLIYVGLSHLVGKRGFLNHPLIKNTYGIRRVLNDGSRVPFAYAPQ